MKPGNLLGSILWFLFLTFISQIGGLVWLFCLPLFSTISRQKNPPFQKWLQKTLGFMIIYLVFCIAVIPMVAPKFGRVPLPAGIGKSNLKPRNISYCLLNRQYVKPSVKTALKDLSNEMNARYPGTKTYYMDAAFPFAWNRVGFLLSGNSKKGFPLLPHLSHGDGRKVDLAFYYQQRDTGQPLKKGPSPLGYAAFEQPTRGEVQPCYGRRSLLRWNFNWSQRLFYYARLDHTRTKRALAFLGNHPNIKKILIEEHLENRMLPGHPKLRFQGCSAARHDDHYHVEGY